VRLAAGQEDGKKRARAGTKEAPSPRAIAATGHILGLLSWAGCTINTVGFDWRQEQDVPAAEKHQIGVEFREQLTGIGGWWWREALDFATATDGIRQSSGECRTNPTAMRLTAFRLWRGAAM